MTRARDLADSADKDIAGTLTLDGLTVAGNVSADGGTIKLDGNYPVGTSNVALGDNTLNGSLTGGYNTAVGEYVMGGLTSGASNSALGQAALGNNTTGAYNTAVGRTALFSNTTASNNTAVGYQALYANTTGTQNVSMGAYALDANTTGTRNTVIGYNAMGANTASTANVAIGDHALLAKTSTGNDNVAIGTYAGSGLTTGSNSTFVGAGAGSSITTGEKNTILGRYNGNQGGLDIRTSSNNIVLSDGDGNPRLYYLSSASAWRSAEIYNNTTGNSANVTILSSGTIARSTSSLKYKRDVVDATHGLSDLLNLRSVTYKGKNPEEGDTVYGGLIAEEVHDAGLTEFVQYDTEGNPDALAYGNMVSLCIKAIQEQQATITALQARIDALENA